MKDNLLKLVKEVRTILSPPGSWTQGEYAKDANGNYTAATGSEAVCWCLKGAKHLAYDRLDYFSSDNTSLFELGEQFRSLLWAVTNGYDSEPIYNDAPGRTQEDVLHMLDQMIQRIESA